MATPRLRMLSMFVYFGIPLLQQVAVSSTFNPASNNQQPTRSWTCGCSKHRSYFSPRLTGSLYMELPVQLNSVFGIIYTADICSQNISQLSSKRTWNLWWFQRCCFFPPDLLGEMIPFDHSFCFHMSWLSHYVCVLISCFQTCQVSLLPARHEEKDPKESGKTSGSLNLKQPPMLAKRYGMFETERYCEIRWCHSERCDCSGWHMNNYIFVCCHGHPGCSMMLTTLWGMD